ncbi:MAG: aminopeptidase P family protein [Deltaproteobacteria bacterium]|jgi:Xaa-Pro aminopeptidase|nr:aminopeptidase P family protein [Deltaproteobacteria bacterium]
MSRTVETPSNKERTLSCGQPQPEIAFPREEYDRRLDAVRDNMSRAGVDLLYVTMPDHLCYLSGYQAEWFQEGGPQTWPGVSGIAVHVDCDRLIHFENQDEKLLAEFTTHALDLRIMPEHDITSGFMAWVIRELKQQGWLGGRAAIEKHSYRPNPADSAQMQALFEREGCEVVDGTHLVAAARKLKSPLEIEAVREAARIGDIGLRAAIDKIEVGMTELDVYAEIVYAMAKAGGENPAITVPVVSGKKSACFHAMSSRKKIEPGDIVNVDVCGVYKRYHSDVCRTISMGEPDPKLKAYIDNVVGALAVAGELIKPGLSVSAFLSDMKRYYEQHDMLQDQWWIGGYELGIAFPPDWVGAYYFDIYKDVDDDVFELGFVSNYEANFYLPCDAGLAALIDTMVFGETRAEFIHAVPAKLFIAE